MDGAAADGGIFCLDGVDAETAGTSARQHVRQRCGDRSTPWFSIPATAVRIPAQCAAQFLEKDLTLDVAQRVDRLLQAEGLATLMTRYGDTFISLADRARFANRARDCIFVSIHFNEGDRPLASGVETYYADHQMLPSPSLISWIPFLSPQSADRRPQIWKAKAWLALSRKQWSLGPGRSIGVRRPGNFS